MNDEVYLNVGIPNDITMKVSTEYLKLGAEDVLDALDHRTRPPESAETLEEFLTFLRQDPEIRERFTAYRTKQRILETQ